MNDNIIPYVPIADRVQATTVESAVLCQKFFLLVDEIIESQMVFNHDHHKGSLCINPAQINDLLAELSDAEEVDVQILEPHLHHLIYPKFVGVKQVNSPIWNNEAVEVWHFQLDRMANRADDGELIADARDYIDEAAAIVRVWRYSLESSPDNPQVDYYVNDLSHILLMIESKLEKAQSLL